LPEERIVLRSFSCCRTNVIFDPVPALRTGNGEERWPRTATCGAITRAAEAMINLDAPEQRAIIDKLVDHASELDALMMGLKEGY